MVATEAVFTLHKEIYHPPLSTREETSRKLFRLLHLVEREGERICQKKKES